MFLILPSLRWHRQEEGNVDDASAPVFSGGRRVSRATRAVTAPSFSATRNRSHPNGRAVWNAVTAIYVDASTGSSL